jgi:hypothetical protein
MIGAPSLMRLSAMQRLGGACVLSGALFALLGVVAASRVLRRR